MILLFIGLIDYLTVTTNAARLILVIVWIIYPIEEFLSYDVPGFYGSGLDLFLGNLVLVFIIASAWGVCIETTILLIRELRRDNAQ